MRKERLARGWSLAEFAQRTGINAGHLSRIENGKRPPTENVAAACDVAFPERKGWFTEYVRREAPCCIPDSVGRNSEIYSWV
jgi:transcriptional regulator with XRE-family HTH domain